jgi:hypothetical protein
MPMTPTFEAELVFRPIALTVAAVERQGTSDYGGGTAR